MSTAWKQNSTRGEKVGGKRQENSKEMKNEFDIPVFLSRRPFPHYAATNWRRRRWDFTAKIRLCYHLRYRQEDWTYTPFQKQAENEKQIRVNEWSAWITGRRGHNEIITSKHCARGVTTVPETDYLCWACERGRDAGNVKKHGWKELIVRQSAVASNQPYPTLFLSILPHFSIIWLMPAAKFPTRTTWNHSK